MTEASRDRPATFTVLHSLSGHIRARPRAVFEALDGRFRPDAGSDGVYRAEPPAFFIVSEGGRWYRGEYRVVPDTDGSNIEHVMLNISPSGRVWGLGGRRTIAQAPAAFETLLQQLRLELE